MGAYFTISGEFVTRTKVTKQGTLDGLKSCFGKLWDGKMEQWVSVTRQGKYRQKVTIEMDYVSVGHRDVNPIMKGWFKCCEMLMDDKILMTAHARYSGDEGDQEYTLRAGKRYIVLNDRIDTLNHKIRELEKERDKVIKERDAEGVKAFYSSAVEDNSEGEFDGE